MCLIVITLLRTNLMMYQIIINFQSSHTLHRLKLCTQITTMSNLTDNSISFEQEWEQQVLKFLQIHNWLHQNTPHSIMAALITIKVHTSIPTLHSFYTRARPKMRERHQLLIKPQLIRHYKKKRITKENGRRNTLL